MGFFFRKSSFGAKDVVYFREDLGTEDGNQADDSEGAKAINLAGALLLLIALFGVAAVLSFLWLILRR